MKIKKVFVLYDEDKELNDLTASMLSLATEENRFEVIHTNNDNESELGDIDDQNAEESLDFGGRSTSSFLPTENRENRLKRRTDIEDDNDTYEESSDLEIKEVAPKARKIYKAKKVNSKASEDHTDSITSNLRHSGFNEDEGEIANLLNRIPSITTTVENIENITPFSPVNYNSTEDARPLKKVYLKHPTLFLGDMSGNFNFYHDDGDNTI